MPTAADFQYLASSLAALPWVSHEAAFCSTVVGSNMPGAFMLVPTLSTPVDDVCLAFSGCHACFKFSS